MAAQAQSETLAAVSAAPAPPRAALCAHAEEHVEADAGLIDDQDCAASVEPPSLGGGAATDRGGDVQPTRQKGGSTGAAEVTDEWLVAACVNESRGACLLPFLNGAAPVCYGVPTRWRSRFSEGSRAL